MAGWLGDAEAPRIAVEDRPSQHLEGTSGRSHMGSGSTDDDTTLQARHRGRPPGSRTRGLAVVPFWVILGGITTAATLAAAWWAGWPDSPRVAGRVGADAGSIRDRWDPARERAWHLIDQGRQEEGLALARTLTEQAGQAAAGWSLVAAAHHAAGRIGPAAEAGLRVLALDPDLGALPVPLGRFVSDLAEDLIDSGHLIEARGMLVRAIERAPEARFWVALGTVEDREADPAAAERSWKQALRIEPGTAEARLNLGRLALRAGRVEEAIDWLEHAEALAPDDYQAPYALGLAYRRLGRGSDAARALVRADARRRRAGPPRGGMGAMPMNPPPR